MQSLWSKIFSNDAHGALTMILVCIIPFCGLTLGGVVLGWGLAWGYLRGAAWGLLGSIIIDALFMAWCYFENSVADRGIYVRTLRWWEMVLIVFAVWGVFEMYHFGRAIHVDLAFLGISLVWFGRRLDRFVRAYRQSTILR